MEILQPPGWQKPRGYVNGIKAQGELVFVAGQIGWDENEIFQSENLAEQIRQALLNTLAVLKEAGAGPEHIVRMTWYILNKSSYLQSLDEIGRVYREVMGKHFPVMAMVEVSALIEDQAQVEIETTAVIP